MTDQDRIIKVNIEEEMRVSYIDYSMSVIVARALPDVRDGFKPVHRRILYGMMGLSNTHDKPYKKCARIVGEVLGKYHPHGDSSVYGALVRMAQEWAMRYPLVDGQGNFGSIDGDSAAAMRYTEARLEKLGEDMMGEDLYKDTVDMTRNFDNTLDEPTVMPTRIPNLLVNGATGIAVGMATNIPTHNLGEVIDASVAYIDNEDIDVDGLMQYVKGPDFPTGACIMGTQGIREAFETGRGRIVIRSKAEIESGAQHDKIVVSEIPYGVNKAELIKRIADLVNEKKIDGISNANDESDREGMRIVIDVKRDANARVVLNKLYKMTDLQSTFSVNTIALVNGRPQVLSLKDCIRYFVEHRHDVVIRRTRFDLKKAQERAHLVEALIVASDNIDEVVRIIRSAENPQAAVKALMDRFGFDEVQAKYVVEMRLRQLTALLQDQLHAEYDDLMKKIEYFNRILTDDALCRQVIKDELLEVKANYGDPRRTQIIPDSGSFSEYDFIEDNQEVITVSHLGYIKRTQLSEFQAQRRNGTGSRGGATRDEDFIEYIHSASTHDMMMFFTKKGRCYWLRVYDIVPAAKNSKGRAIQNMLNIDPDDKVTAFLCLRDLNNAEFVNSHYLVFCTKQGIVKRTLLANFSHPRQMGIIALNLVDGDEVVNVSMSDGEGEIMIASRKGRAIRFKENQVRVMGRNSTGVRSIRLEESDDEVIGMVYSADPENDIVATVAEHGLGKRSRVKDFRLTGRRSKGSIAMRITERTGLLVAIQLVTDNDDLMIINKSGIVIRLRVLTIPTISRYAQGVKLINLAKRNDHIASVCVVPSDPDSDAVDSVEGLESVEEGMTLDAPQPVEEDIDEPEDDIEESEEPENGKN